LRRAENTSAKIRCFNYGFRVDGGADLKIEEIRTASPITSAGRFSPFGPFGISAALCLGSVLKAGFVVNLVGGPISDDDL
jgi:hypothetical protein